ncbi:MAG: hypothetical protein NTY19_15320 [Planctomycetota bacterium]|nr:hypothetical protein [Planctomycetota bacterium]
MAPQVVVRWNPLGNTERWQPTTLDRLNKDEKFFEEVLAGNVELLGLESRRTGIHGPFAIWRQLDLETPSGRSISPDIVILAASGHVIVVEVKRYVNPELRDRAVIAQIIDYASSFAALSEQQATQVFGEGEDTTWTELVQRYFPNDPISDELAGVFLERLQSGELNLVIACDKIPAGLPDVVSGIASQRALGFDLDLVEVVPFVRESTETAEILFVPSTRLATEIVSRTAVTVTYRQGDQRPSTTVQTTPIDVVVKRDISVKRKRTSTEPVSTQEFYDELAEVVGNQVAGQTRKFMEDLVATRGLHEDLTKWSHRLWVSLWVNDRTSQPILQIGRFDGSICLVNEGLKALEELDSVTDIRERFLRSITAIDPQMIPQRKPDGSFIGKKAGPRNLATVVPRFPQLADAISELAAALKAKSPQPS